MISSNGFQCTGYSGLETNKRQILTQRSSGKVDGLDGCGRTRGN